MIDSAAETASSSPSPPASTARPTPVRALITLYTVLVAAVTVGVLYRQCDERAPDPWLHAYAALAARWELAAHRREQGQLDEAQRLEAECEEFRRRLIERDPWLMDRVLADVQTRGARWAPPARIEALLRARVLDPADPRPCVEVVQLAARHASPQRAREWLQEFRFQGVRFETEQLRALAAVLGDVAAGSGPQLPPGHPEVAPGAVPPERE